MSMLSKLAKRFFGWKEPVLPYAYSVTRVSRDVFAVKIGGRTARLPAEVGDRIGGKYEVVLYPVAGRHWAEDASPISDEDNELLLHTLQQFLTANNYVVRRA